MTDGDLLEQVRLYLPKYLSPERQEELFTELRSFPHNRSLFQTASVAQSALLQGDGWRGFVVIHFFTTERKTVSGVILSNSCDVDSANARTLRPNVLFAPLIRLARYEERLRSAGRSPERIAALLEAVRLQRVTSLFYVPAEPEVTEESVVALDDIHSHPLDDFVGASPQRIFSLNNFGFYLFLFKLSIHFTRFQENVDRS